MLPGVYLAGTMLNACSSYVPHKTDKEGTTKLDVHGITERAIQLQRDYWVFDPKEKTELLSRYPDSLSWPEILRLHHLICLELLNTKRCRAQWLNLDDKSASHHHDAPKSLTLDFCKELIQLLVSAESPYRPRRSSIWHGRAGQSERNPPGLEGILRNASLTHLGCIEIIRFDENTQPKELAFIPFDDIRGILFGKLSIFRLAKILYYDSSRDEVVFAPLLYGVSWFTNYKMDHDGSFTRFCCNFHMNGYEYHFSIGVGHQDFIMSEDEGLQMGSLFGLGSIGEIMFPLETNDPKFDQKCRFLGWDPEAIRKDLKKNDPNKNNFPPVK
jgi:hypothetical protein